MTAPLGLKETNAFIAYGRPKAMEKEYFDSQFDQHPEGFATFTCYKVRCSN